MTNFSAFLIDFAEISASARPPSGRRQTVAHMHAAHIDQFERAAAEIADDAIGAMHAGNYAERGKFRLASAGQHFDVGADGALGELDEWRAVLGIAHRRRGDGEDFLDVHRFAQRAKTLERRECVLNRVGGEQSCRLHLATEAAQGLFVEQFGRAARQPLVDNEAYRIRTDVDDGNRRTVIEPALGGERGHGRGTICRALSQAAAGGARRGFFERLAAAGQARIGHEIVVELKFSSPGAGHDARRRTITAELPALLVVLEIGDHDLVEHLFVHRRIEDRAQHFDATVEIARHHVGRRNVDRRFRMRQAMPGAEAIDAAVFEEAADDRFTRIARIGRERPAAGSRCRAPRGQQVRRHSKRHTAHR